MNTYYKRKLDSEEGERKNTATRKIQKLFFRKWKKEKLYHINNCLDDINKHINEIETIQSQ